ncbi:hypothetical protein Y032_0065g3634 [Ancylostoma ceylanicum]|nr:hypothetical protein Y032_0065g3634 [Ancylostoma ceylanicum]
MNMKDDLKKQLDRRRNRLRNLPQYVAKAEHRRGETASRETTNEMDRCIRCKDEPAGRSAGNESKLSSTPPKMFMDDDGEEKERMDSMLRSA